MTMRSPGGPATILFAHRARRDWIRGSEQCLLDLVTGLDHDRFRSVVICDAPVLAREAERAGATAVVLDAWGNGPVRPPAVRARVAGLLRAHGASVVHVNTPDVLPAFLPGARAQRVPVLAHLHLPSTRADRLHGLLHQADAIVGVSRFVLAPLHADGFDPARLHMIYNGVNLARLGPPLAANEAAAQAAILRATLGVPPGALLAAGIGSLIHRKAHDVTIRALAVARAHGAAVHLMLAGDGEEDAALHALANEHGVSACVHFLGYRGDVGAVLRAADLVVTSAREETLGLNVLEAQALGCAVVASDIPPHREAIASGITGLLVPLERADALGEVLAMLAADPARRTALGAAGPSWVGERFAMARYVSAFDELYTTLLRRPRAAYGWVRGARWPVAYTRWAAQVMRRQLGLAIG